MSVEKQNKELDVWDFENGFYHFSAPERISKLIAHYELYKMIVNLPGHIVELGVYKATSFIRFCTFRNMLESSYSRKILGFDMFGKFPRPQSISNDDSNFISAFEGAGGEGLSIAETNEILANKEFSNYELIQGDMLESIPLYLEKHPELRIALLHIDVDIYEPSIFGLKMLYDRVVPSGLIVFDDYGIVSGETDAVDEFFKDKNVVLNKFSFCHRPAYIIKK